MSNEIRSAPFTNEECEHFNAFQEELMFHPFTCGNDSSHKVLVATPDGLICPDCDYTQNWMHGMQATFRKEDWTGEGG